jgi:DNA-directed RNA polymerase specialized sigma24 family protein
VQRVEAEAPHHQPPELPPEKTYPTCLGAVTFADLYEQTHRIAGSIMHNQLGMTNPEDIDDCLQEGFLKVWQKLETEPDWLADKPKRYVVQAVVLHSKVQRYCHLRHYRKMVWDAEPAMQSASDQITTSKVDTWLDIAQALGKVATAVEDDPLMLLSLYTLITDTKAVDVSRELGVNYKTLAKRRPKTRSLVAQELAAYRPTNKTDLAISQAEPLPKQPATQRLPVTTWLLEDRPLLWSEVEPVLKAEPVTPPPVRRYTTRWSGRMTLETILADPQVKRSAYAKLHQLGLVDEADQQDCLQEGAIKLWQALEKDPQLLADKGAVWLGIYLTYSGNPKRFLRHSRRQHRFDHPDFDWTDAEEYLLAGDRAGQGREAVGWEQQVDEQVDLARFMSIIANRYAQDTQKLLALYALTTSVQTKDVAPVIGLHPKNYAAAVGNQVKQEVRSHYRLFQELVERNNGFGLSVSGGL